MTIKRVSFVLVSLVAYGIIIYLVYLWVTPYPYKIINHEKPSVQAEFSPFMNIGCKYWAYDLYNCEEGSPLLNLGCNTIEDKPLLGGLLPNYPIAGCILEIDENMNVVDVPDNECFYIDGGFITICTRYIIYKDGKYQLVKTMDEFRTLYAPVDSPDEVLSFALAVGDYFAGYGQTRRGDYVYSVKEMEDTFVETTTDGYLVHVFSTPAFGCGPFETNAVQIKVTYDGNVEEVSRHPVYRDPSEDNMCVD